MLVNVNVHLVRTENKCNFDEDFVLDQNINNREATMQGLNIQWK